MTTLTMFGGDLGRDTIRVSCDLSRAESTVFVEYNSGEGWAETQYQCADCRHSWNGLASIARKIAAAAVEVPLDDFRCDVTDEG